jgi:hypothetical protein
VKVGNVDGTPEEIRDLIENNGLNLAEFVGVDRLRRPRIRWVVIPAVTFVLALAVQVPMRSCSLEVRTISLVFAGALLTWLCASVHFRFDSKGTTLTTALGSILLLLASSGLITFLDAYKRLEAMAK